MFCMKCGQQLPDGASFCMKCGTPLGSVSPTVTTKAETINIDGMHTFVPAMCPNCNSHMKVVSSYKLARCPNCGTECLVQDAIKNLSVKGNIQVGSATINVNGTNTGSLLKRVEIMLADGEFAGARSKCDAILDSDPTNGSAYFFMLMICLACRKREDLKNQLEPFDKNIYYLKVMQYGDINLKNELNNYLNIIYSRINAKQERIEAEQRRIEAEQRRIEAEREKNTINPRVGTEIYFGAYKGERIVWTVLKIENHFALIISSNIICKMPYNEVWVQYMSYKDCTLRKWLNDDFINCCFTPKERARMIPHLYEIRGIPKSDIAFLLSRNEAEHLFSDNQSRAIDSSWWLRNQYGDIMDFSRYCKNGSYVCEDGTILGGLSSSFSSQGIGVRPVMWIRCNP